MPYQQTLGPLEPMPRIGSCFKSAHPAPENMPVLAALADPLKGAWHSALSSPRTRLARILYKALILLQSKGLAEVGIFPPWSISG